MTSPEYFSFHAPKSGYVYTVLYIKCKNLEGGTIGKTARVCWRFKNKVRKYRDGGDRELYEIIVDTARDIITEEDVNNIHIIYCESRSTIKEQLLLEHWGLYLLSAEMHASGWSRRNGHI